MAEAANCFDTEPASKTVSGAFTLPSSRSADPYARVRTSRPSLLTPTAQPGVSAVQSAKTASTLEAGSPTTGCASPTRGVTDQRNATTTTSARNRTGTAPWPAVGLTRGALG